MQNSDKIEAIFDTLKSFCDQFGKDEYSRVFLEVLFEEICTKKNLSLFSEERPEGNNSSDNSISPTTGNT